MSVGPQMAADGSTPATAPRQGKSAEAIVGQAHGKYYEATSRGKVYSGANGSTGRAPGTALGVSPSILLYNPAGSNTRLAILKVSTGLISGTMGAGTLFHCGFSLSGPLGSQAGVAPVVGSGASITPSCLDVGSGSGSVATAFSLGTLNANPVILYPFLTISQEVVATTALAPDMTMEDVDGLIVLESGGGWCLEGVAAAGTSPLVSSAVVWEEIPFV